MLKLPTEPTENTVPGVELATPTFPELVGFNKVFPLAPGWMVRAPLVFEIVPPVIVSP